MDLAFDYYCFPDGVFGSTSQRQLGRNNFWRLAVGLGFNGAYAWVMANATQPRLGLYPLN